MGKRDDFNNAVANNRIDEVNKLLEGGLIPARKEIKAAVKGGSEEVALAVLKACDELPEQAFTGLIERQNKSEALEKVVLEKLSQEAANKLLVQAVKKKTLRVLIPTLLKAKNLKIDKGAQLPPVNITVYNILDFALGRKDIDEDTVLKLVEAGADVVEQQGCNEDGLSVLHKAVLKGWDKVVDALLARDDYEKFINLKDKDGLPAIYYAASHKKNAVLGKLLGKGAEIKPVRPKNQTNCFVMGDVLHHVAIHGDIENLKRILALPNKDQLINGFDNYGNTPLFYLARNGMDGIDRNKLAEAAELLIDAGADVNRDCYNRGDRMTPVQLAATNGLTELVQVLVEKGAELDETVLPNAMDGGHTKIVVYLVEQKAPGYENALNMVCSQYRRLTPEKKLEMATALIAVDGIIAATNAMPLQRFQQSVLGDNIGFPKILKLLVDSGITIGAVLAMQTVVGEGNPNVDNIEVLMKIPGIVDSINNDNNHREGQSLLEKALKNNDILEILLKAGVKNDIDSALKKAFSYQKLDENNVELVKLLLKHGAKVEMDKDGNVSEEIESFHYQGWRAANRNKKGDNSPAMVEIRGLLQEALEKQDDYKQLMAEKEEARKKAEADKKAEQAKRERRASSVDAALGDANLDYLIQALADGLPITTDKELKRVLNFILDKEDSGKFPGIDFKSLYGRIFIKATLVCKTSEEFKSIAKYLEDSDKESYTKSAVKNVIDETLVNRERTDIIFNMLTGVTELEKALDNGFKFNKGEHQTLEGAVELVVKAKLSNDKEKVLLDKLYQAGQECGSRDIFDGYIAKNRKPEPAQKPDEQQVNHGNAPQKDDNKPNNPEQQRVLNAIQPPAVGPVKPEHGVAMLNGEGDKTANVSFADRAWKAICDFFAKIRDFVKGVFGRG